MPFLVLNLLKVGFLLALFGFLAIVARAMRSQVAGPHPSGSGPPTAPAEAPPAPLPGLLVEHADSEPREYRLDRDLLIGRSEAADVTLSDDYTSERHAIVSVEGTRLWVEDLGSTNGTTVDGRPVEAKTAIQRGSTIVVGRTKMVVR